MAYFKFTSEPVMVEAAKYTEAKQKLLSEGDLIAKHFGGKALYSTDSTSSNFFGLVFDDIANLKNNHLWTAPKSKLNYAVWPKRLKTKESKALIAEYESLKPKSISSRELYKSMGFDFGDVMFCGLTMKITKDAVYLKTNIKLDPQYEILGSEFDAAK